MKQKIFLLFIFTTAKNIFSQDVNFTQPIAFPSFLNPAFTGWNKAPSANLQYRADRYNTIIAGAEIAYKNFGFGFSYMNDNTVLIINREAALKFSYNKTFKKDFSIRAGLGISNIWKEIPKNYIVDRLTHRDPRTHAFISDTSMHFPINPIHFPNANFGMALNYKNLLLSYTINNLIEPDDEFYHSTAPLSTLKRNYIFYAAYMFEVGKDFKILPSYTYRQQKYYTQISTGLLFNYKYVTAGFSRDWKGSGNYFNFLNLHCGVTLNNFRISYSYNSYGRHFVAYIGIVEIPQPPIHEISLTFLAGKNKNNNHLQNIFRKFF